jgi:hypothetical protein
MAYKTKVWRVWFMVILLGSGLVHGLISEPKSEPRDLIRMDLLTKEKGKNTPPRRNIFSLHNVQSSPALQRMSEAKRKQEAAKRAREEQARNDTLSLRYIGYVNSARNTVGLVIYEGEVFAVVRGDILDEGVEVVSISVKEIEILGPDSKKRRFPLEEDEL